jgi:uncharacterized protein
MGDLSAEPSMEDILSSIKRIIAEEGEGGGTRPRQRTARTAPRPEPAEEVLELSEPVPEPPAPPAPSPVDAEPIVSPRAAEAARGKLDALSRLIVRPEAPGSDTLEGLVRDMLRPMLADWLDAHLPEIVERVVAREVSRIVGDA